MFDANNFEHPFFPDNIWHKYSFVINNLFSAKYVIVLPCNTFALSVSLK
jgi:hypothetical protein